MESITAESIAASDLNILNKSESQLSRAIFTAQRSYSAHLMGAQKVLAAAPAGAPPSTDLNDILNNAVQAPGTTSITTVPNTPDTMMYQLLGQVQTLDSYISLLTAYCVYNEHPAPYDISKPADASAFTRAMAKWRNYVTTGGNVKALAGYLPVSSIVTQSYSKEVTSLDLHLEFLSELFGSFSFPEATIKQLDGILTKVVAQLGNLKVSFESENATLDQFLTFYYFSTVAGTGGKNQPPAMYVAKVRTFYLQINQKSWKVAVGKSSVARFQFNMNYFDMDTTMNSGLVASDMSAINSSIQTLTGQTAAQLNKLMNMQAVRADPQK